MMPEEGSREEALAAIGLGVAVPAVIGGVAIGGTVAIAGLLGGFGLGAIGLATAASAGLGALAAGGASIYLGGGKNTAKIQRLLFYNEDINRKLRKFMGKSPNPMIVNRLDNLKEAMHLTDGSTAPKGSIVLDIDDFSFFDADETRTEIESISEDVNLEELDRARDEAKKSKEEISAQKEDGSFEYYNIRLYITDQNVKVGEIDFSDWRKRPDVFKIEITKKPVDKNIPLNPQTDAAEYKKVLDNLQRYTKVSHAKSWLAGSPLTPEKDANSHISVSSGTGWFGRKLNWVKSFWDPTVGIQNDTDAGENPHINSDDYMRGLVHLAIDKAIDGEDQDLDIVDNYYQILEQALQNKLLFAQKIKKKREAEIAKRKEGMKPPPLKKILKNIFKAIRTIGFVAAITMALGFIMTRVPFLSPLGGKLIEFGVKSIKNLNVAGFEVSAGTIGSAAIALGISGATMAAIGGAAIHLIFTTVPEFQLEHLESAKKERDEAEALEKELDQKLSNLRILKYGARYTLDKVLELTNEDTLDLTERVIGDLGVSILSEYANRENINFPCSKLILQKCRLTDIGATEIAKMLENAQSLPGQANINSIDLSGNPYITKNGVKAIAEALEVNCSITTIKLDELTLDVPLIKQVQKQIIINRYIQGIDLGLKDEQIRVLFPNGIKEIHTLAKLKIESNYKMVEFRSTRNPLLQKTLENCIKQNRLFTRIREIKPETEEATGFIARIKKAYEDVKNAILVKPTIEEGVGPSGEEYLEAFKANPTRCMGFLDKEIDSPELRDSLHLRVKIAISENPLTFLKGLSSSECEELLKPIIMKKQLGNFAENVKIFTRLLEKISSQKDTDEDLMMLAQDILRKSFIQIGDQRPETFIEKLKEKRKKIAQSIEYSIEVKRTMLNIIDSAVNPELGDIDSFEFKKHQLQKIASEHPISPPAKMREAFKEFIEIYKTIDIEKAPSVFEGMDNSKFLELIREDIYDKDAKKTRYAQLRRPDLSEEHKQHLFEFVFKPRGDNKFINKAILMANLLANEVLSELILGKDDGLSVTSEGKIAENLRESYLYYAIPWDIQIPGIRFIPLIETDTVKTLRAYTFKEISDEIKVARERALLTGKAEFARELDKPLQAVIKANLVIKCKCLRDPLSKTDFDKLKKWLESKEGYELRRFEFDEELEIHPDVKKYIEDTIIKNKVKNEIDREINDDDGYNLRVSLVAAIMDYAKMDPKLFAPPAIDSKKLLSRIKADFNGPRPLDNLTSLVNENRTGLDKERIGQILKTCFDGNEGADKKASLVLKLLDMGGKFIERNTDTIYDNEDVKAVIGKSLSNNSYENVRNDLIEQIKQAKSNSRIESADLMDKILQTQETEDLTKAFDCLKGPDYDMSDFDSLETELLEKNFVLRNFETPSDAHQKVKNLITLVTNRNKLYDALRDHPDPKTKLVKFAEILESLPSKDREKALTEYMKKDGDTLFALVKADTYPNNCIALKAIAERLRAEIIERCLRKQEGKMREQTVLNPDTRRDIRAIAIMASKIMNGDPKEYYKQTWGIFNWEEIRVVWSLFKYSGTHTRFDLKGYIEQLKEIRTEANAEVIDKALQSGYQELLISRLGTHKPAEWLERELQENFYLTDAEGFNKSRIHPNAKKIIELYCKRNKLLKLLPEGPEAEGIDEALKEFKEIYETTPKDKVQKLFEENKKVLILIRMLDELSKADQEVLYKKDGSEIDIDKIIRDAFRIITTKSLKTQFIPELMKKIAGAEEDENISINKTKAIADIIEKAIYPEKYNTPTKLRVAQIKRMAARPEECDMGHFISLIKDVPVEELCDALEEEKISIFARIIKGAEDVDPEVLDKDEDELNEAINYAFNHLDQNLDDFESKLREEIIDITETDDTIDMEKRKLIVDIIEKALNPEKYSIQAGLRIAQLKRLSESEETKVDHFLSIYEDIPLEKLDEALEGTDRLTILRILKKDLSKKDLVSNDQDVKCELLRNLDEKYRVRLLAHCFSLNEPSKEIAYKKATLISEIMKIPGLFKEPDNKSKRDIKKYLVYWGITPEQAGIKGGYHGGDAAYYKWEDYTNEANVNEYYSFDRRVRDIPAELSTLQDNLKNAIATAKSAEIPEQEEVVEERVSAEKLQNNLRT